MWIEGGREGEGIAKDLEPTVEQRNNFLATLQSGAQF